MTHEGELWQIFDENGVARHSIGYAKQELTADRIVGASHVWIWRKTGDGTMEVLLQRRASDKSTWPDYLDISAAGHINLGEAPLDAAVRETQEEIGITPLPEDFQFIFAHRKYVEIGHGKSGKFAEMQWVYLLEICTPMSEFVFVDGEVEDVRWIAVAELTKGIKDDSLLHIVPHGSAYFAELLFHIGHLQESL